MVVTSTKIMNLLAAMLRGVRSTFSLKVQFFILLGSLNQGVKAQIS